MDVQGLELADRIAYVRISFPYPNHNLTLNRNQADYDLDYN